MAMQKKCPKCVMMVPLKNRLENRLVAVLLERLQLVYFLPISFY
jgi:hypothetical protein